MAKKKSILDDIKDLIIDDTPETPETPEVETESVESVKPRKEVAKKPRKPKQTKETSTRGIRMTFDEMKYMARLFLIYRLHTTNTQAAKEGTFFTKYVGETYQIDRQDPNEVRALEYWMVQNTIRSGQSVASSGWTVSGTNAGIAPIGSDGFEVTLGDDGIAIISGGDALATDGAAHFFMLEFLIKADNDAITVQNFSGYDNVTFCGGQDGDEANSFFNALDGERVEKVAFLFQEGEPNSGPGTTESNEVKLKFQGGNPGDTVQFYGIKLYDVVPKP